MIQTWTKKSASGAFDNIFIWDATSSVAPPSPPVKPTPVFETLPVFNKFRIIANAANYGIFNKEGTVPDVSGALQDYFQNMVFTMVSKIVMGFQVDETPNPVYFRGTVQPFTDRQLMLKPEGQRAWTWHLLISDPVLALEVDDVVLWKGKQTRVMSKKDNSLYGFIEYHLCQDWEGAGP